MYKSNVNHKKSKKKKKIKQLVKFVKNLVKPCLSQLNQMKLCKNYLHMYYMDYY